MGYTYVGLAMSAQMFPQPGLWEHVILSPEEAKSYIAKTMEDGSFSCCMNASHAATIEALKKRFDLDLPVPPEPPKVRLEDEDALLVMQITGLPRLTDRYNYTDDEVETAQFLFHLWKPYKA